MIKSENLTDKRRPFGHPGSLAETGYWQPMGLILASRRRTPVTRSGFSHPLK